MSPDTPGASKTGTGWNIMFGPIFALLLSVGLLLMGHGLQGTLLPIRAGMENFSAFDIGLVGSAYFLGFAIGCVYGPYLVRRVGHIRAFTAMVAIASCTVLSHAMVLQPLVWWILRLASGFCFAVLYMVIESWLNEKSTNENRGLVFSIYTIINLTVITIGQLMMMLSNPASFPLFCLASILISLAAVPVALTRSSAPEPIESVRLHFSRLIDVAPVGVAGSLAVGLANGPFWALGPLFAQGEDMNINAVALFMSVTVIGGALGQWPLGRMSDRVDRRRVIVLACGGAAVAGTGLVVFHGTWPSLVLIAGFMFGFFAFPLYSLSIAHANDHAEPSEYVEFAGGMLLVFALGAVLGPILASVCVRYLGIGSLFMFSTAVYVATLLFTLHRLRMRRVEPEVEHVEFVEVLRSAQTVANLDLSQQDE